MTATVQIYDPALCCPTGICGPSVDPGLVAFAADVEWLVKCGVSVERYNLAQQPQAFVDSHAAKRTLERDGASGLPLTVVDGVVKCSGRYPSREQLAEWSGVDVAQLGEAPVSPVPLACGCGPSTDDPCESKGSPSLAAGGGCCGGTKRPEDAAEKSPKCC